LIVDTDFAALNVVPAHELLLCPVNWLSLLWQDTEHVYCVRSVPAEVWQSLHWKPPWLPDSAKFVVTAAWLANVPPDQVTCPVFAVA
jgi:hypothetical protein